MDKSFTHTDCFSVWLILTLHVLVSVNLVYISAYRSPWIIHTGPLKPCPYFFIWWQEGFFLQFSLYTPLQRRPVRSAGVRSPGRPRCRSVAVSPPDGGCTSLALQRCWPDAPCPIAERRGGQCCTSFLPPGEEQMRHNYITQGHNRIPKEKIMLRFHKSSFLVPLITVCNVPKP